MEVVATTIYGGTAVAYTIAGLTHLLLAFRRQWEQLARWSTRGAWALHTVALLLVVLQTGRVPVYTVFEAALAVTWLLITGYVSFEFVLGNQAIGAVLVPLTFALVLAAMALPKPAGTEVLVANLPASLIFWHVSIILLGYIGLVSAFVAGCMYLLLDYLLRRKAFHPIYYRLPSLETLDVWGHRAVVAGFPLLTLGILTGLFFAAVSWQELWLRDPKVLGTSLNWCLYLGYLVSRRWGGWGGRRAAWWSIAGFAGVLVNYFIINAFLTELHRFGI